MPKPTPDFEVMKLAVEVTKSALGTAGQWGGTPDRVATMLETVAYKITDLLYGGRQ